MPAFTTWPTLEELSAMAAKTPNKMRPSGVPLAVTLEAYLSPEECDEIIEIGMAIKPYTFAHCNAETRELGHIPALDSISQCALWMNDSFWRYNLDPEPVSWMQTYREGGSYQMHADSAPGQMRKLTAVALLSDPNNYGGGKLELNLRPATFVPPQTRGTIVVFQPWLLHRVLPVTRGLRQTINMGFWGPDFQ